MTPSVAAASPTVAPAAPFAVVSTAVHDREWWAVEAVRAGTDWSGLVAAALEMMVAAGIIEQPEPKTMTTWDGPSWREARGRVSPRLAEPARCRDRAEAPRAAARADGGRRFGQSRMARAPRHHPFSKANFRKGISR